MTQNCRKMSERLWEGRRLLELVMLRRDGDAPLVKSQLSFVAVFLGVVSRTPDVINCGKLLVDVIKILDRCYVMMF